MYVSGCVCVCMDFDTFVLVRVCVYVGVCARLVRALKCNKRGSKVTPAADRPGSQLLIPLPYPLIPFATLGIRAQQAELMMQQTS